MKCLRLKFWSRIFNSTNFLNKAAPMIVYWSGFNEDKFHFDNFIYNHNG
jgi:hypothetical protein